MLASLINRYKTYKKRTVLNTFSSYKNKYAFVGVGGHSLSNLYPVIDFLGLPLKYICTKTEENARLIAKKYNCEGTSDFDKILSDDEVKGVFICTSPTAHFSLVKRALQAGKHVFVEKPPCLSKAELEELIALQKEQVVVVGVQKRYSKSYQLLKKKLKNPISYNYKYLTGAYPEGDPIFDLFIHPLDVVSFLFGETKAVSTLKSNGTTQVLVQHQSGVNGVLELSTDYTWDGATEELTVNTPSGIFEAKNSFELSFTPKSKVVMGIPLEKVLKQAQTKTMFISNNGFVPISEFNALNLQGYFDEINTFVEGVEKGSCSNQSTLKSLVPTFELINKLK